MGQGHTWGRDTLMGHRYIYMGLGCVGQGHTYGAGAYMGQGHTYEAEIHIWGRDVWGTDTLMG